MFGTTFFQYQMDMIFLRLDARHAIVKNKTKSQFSKLVDQMLADFGINK